MNTFIRKQFIILFLLFSTGNVLAEESATTMAEDSGTTTSEQNRWSYYGNISATGEVIRSNFSTSKAPAIGDTLTVSTDISVRVSPPTPGYTMGEKIDAIAAGTQVKVVDVFIFPGANQQSLIWINIVESN